jgi:hypothetical protein
MKFDYSLSGHLIRLLRERDSSRDNGDKLATAVNSFLTGKLSEEELCLALRSYQKDEGWNGAACSMRGDLEDFNPDWNWADFLAKEDEKRG